MNNNQVINLVRINEDNNAGCENRIIEWNVSDPAESLYAVVTPIKLK